MILNYFQRFFYFFSDYKKAFVKYSILSVVAAVLELCGVALIYPFVIKLLAENKEEVSKSYILLIGLAIVGVFLLKNVFMVAYTYIQGKFIARFELVIRKRLMNFFLSTNYQDIAKIPYAQKHKLFGTLLSNIMYNFILRLLNLNINILIFVLISVCIAMKFPLASFISVVCAVLLIKLQDKVYQPLLARFSQRVSKSVFLNNLAFNEAILNLKSIKVSGNEKYFYNNYVKYAAEYFENYRKSSFMTMIPPYIIEPFAIILLAVLLAVIAIQNYATPDKLIASIAMVATAIFRLTPAIARIQTNLNGINASLVMVKEFIDFYEVNDIKNIQEMPKIEYCKFTKNLELRNISFGYELEKPVLRDINLVINKGDFVGIAGLSGVGKTTLVDIVAGLYSATSGEILVDGEPQNGRLKIGYIPQEFCLIAGSVRENVAFGADEIDDGKVVDALKKAQLYDFIVDNYKNGIYEKAFVESEGLSLGQKQRMAIARALYSNPDILILDEATSSLDLKTEDEICHVLNELKGSKTIIVIAHRLSTIKSADKIVFMESGTITDIQPFNRLIETSSSFNDLVKIAYSAQ